MIRLKVTTGESKGRAYEGEADLVRLGRVDTSDLQLDDHHVSGEHASVVFTGHGWVLRDHHSTNGTRVLRSGETLDLAAQAGRELGLVTGDVIALGEAGAGAVRVEVEVDEEDDDAGIVSVRNISELQQVEQSVDRDLLHQLYDAQKEISGAIELDAVIDRVAERAFAFLSRATHVTVALREEDESGKSKRSSRYVPMGTRVRGGDAGETIPITRSVFKKVVRERAAVLAADAKRDVGETASLMAAQILSTMGVPLWQGDELLGVLQVDNRDAKGNVQRR